ncbi:hypothetical protein RhiirA4_472476 [Rhizophagus irregularis]|uniref:Uncharacterized protein n=1 Tax=Rhizophagus irregularis TaxID=588596 RepID=A0A2I1H4Z2_9GLOM|nr:hypothetical protein RhiirA4_472476 [Rhizophagus irregularis]
MIQVFLSLKLFFSLNILLTVNTNFHLNLLTEQLTRLENFKRNSRLSSNKIQTAIPSSLKFEAQYMVQAMITILEELSIDDLPNL